MGYRNYTGPKYDPSGDLALAKGFESFSDKIASGVIAAEKKKQQNAEKEAKKLEDRKKKIAADNLRLTNEKKEGRKGLKSINDASDSDSLIEIDPVSMDILTKEVGEASVRQNDPSLGIEEFSKANKQFNDGIFSVQQANETAKRVLETGDTIVDAYDRKGSEGGFVSNIKEPEVAAAFEQWQASDTAVLKRKKGGQWQAYDKTTGKELKIPENIQSYIIPELSKSIDENKSIIAIGDGIKSEFESEAAKVSFIENKGQSNAIYTYHKDIAGSGTIVATVNRDYLLDKMGPEIGKEVDTLYKSNPKGLVNYYNELIKEEGAKPITEEDLSKNYGTYKQQLQSEFVDRYIDANAGDLKAVARQGLSYAQQVANYKKGTEDASSNLANSANEWLKGVYDAIEYKPTYDDLGTVSRDLSSTFVGRSFGKNFKVHSIEKKSIKGMPAEKYTFNLISRSGSTVDPETGETKPPKVDTFDVDFRNPSSLAQFYLALSGESTKLKGKDKNEVFMFLENTFKQALASQGQDAKTVNDSYTQGPSLDLYEDTSSIGLTPNADGTVNIDPKKQQDLDNLGNIYDTNSK